MARVGIIFGLLLCGLTVAAMVGTVAKMPSQFVPMMVGIPIFFCGIVGLNPHRRKSSMHSAATIGLLGLLFGIGLSIYSGVRLPDGQSIDAYVFKVGLAMAVLCFLFVGACVGSFVQTRSRKASE